MNRGSRPGLRVRNRAVTTGVVPIRGASARIIPRAGRMGVSKGAIRGVSQTAIAARGVSHDRMDNGRISNGVQNNGVSNHVRHSHRAIRLSSRH